MSDVEKLLSRIAALEAKLAERPAAQVPAGIDQRALTADPIGTLQRAGVPLDYLTQVLVAHHLGDQAPPQLRMLAAMGPQISATQAVSSDVQAVRQRLDAIDERDRQNSLRQSLSALTSDKTKYPLLAAAYARNPAVFDADIASHRGDAAALAETVESRLKVLAPALGAPAPTASTANAGTAEGHSEQTEQAQGGTSNLDNTPPPLPSAIKSGSFTQADHDALKQRILAKAQAGGYQRR